MPTVLSTKNLKENQRSLMLNAGIALVEYNAIKIEYAPFEVPTRIENAIFTSQNAVKAFSLTDVRSSVIKNCFCVGEKTKQLLKENDQNVVETAEYASELADYLVKNHKKDSFHFFCGNIRSDEIPSKLKENNINFEEIEVYKTTLSPKKFERQFDAVLFFSPSGVRSFVSENKINNSKAICIGSTTATEAKKHTENVVIANATTVESVIAKVVNSLKIL
ncbi:MAG: uroporphyrinogen-III synthase [Aequorivita sp.]|nr:MAG: uroporphyrinogen-III synthase [Aequorivita sp.]